MWNIANKLTMLRVILVPVYVAVFMLVPGTAGKILSLFIFIGASLTDMLDGRLARTHGLVTDFGKFMDPLADKLLVGSALICFVETRQLAAWIVIVLIGREFIISGLRLLAAGKSIVIAAHFWGKLKTVCQMVMICLIILALPYAWYGVLVTVFVVLSVVLSIVSLIDYFVSNAGIFTEK